MTSRAADMTSAKLRALAPQPPARRFHQAREVWRRLRHSGAAMVGMGVLAFLALLALLGPSIAPYDPIAISTDQLLPPSPAHLFGTDNLGRDVLTRVIYGARTSLTIGIFVIAIAASLGTALGLASGYFGRWTDFLIMRVVDTMLAFPGLLLALSIVAVLGANLTNAMIALAIAAVPSYTRVVRASVLQARENDYVAAARVVGASDMRIMVRHLLPNVLAPIIVISTLGIGTAILAAAALSFLGMGVKPPAAEWGSMVGDGKDYLRRAWWMTTFPGMAVMVTVLAINMVGDGLRDALDPRLKDRS